MDAAAFRLGEEINNRRVTYVLNKALWNRFDYPALNIRFSEWTSIKYLNDDGNDLNEDIDVVPNNTGGLYLFYIRCHIIIGITEFPLYIGRAQLTENQNLRKRVKEYFQKYSRNDERPKITTMMNYWGKDLHVAFYPLNNNADVINIEKDVINSLLLPMNDQIPDKIIKQAIQAFDI